ncbi:MAG: acyl-CoA thioesterase [Anaeroplasmataceae bacterium]
MKNYVRKINYYETDQMGVVHHSNYIRFFEEARCYFLECIGYPYNKLEEEKIASPVINVSCEYKKSVKYGDTVNIEVRIISISKVKATFEYKVFDNKTLELRAIGKSEHCFINENGRVISMEKYNPDFFKALLNEEETI